MKKVFSFIWEEILKKIDWKTVVYTLYKDVIRDGLKKLVDNPNSKWDDILIDCLDKLVEAFLKPVK